MLPGNPFVTAVPAVESGVSEKARAAKNPWLEAWSDPVAGLRTSPKLVRLSDLHADGNTRLVVATTGPNPKLKVYAGTVLERDVALLESPCALAEFYPEKPTARSEPLLAVAAGASVFVYRTLRPYAKFTIPRFPPPEKDRAIWEQVAAAPAVSPALCSQLYGILRQAYDAGFELSTRSLDFLSLGAEPSGAAAALAASTAVAAAAASSSAYASGSEGIAADGDRGGGTAAAASSFAGDPTSASASTSTAAPADPLAEAAAQLVARRTAFVAATRAQPHWEVGAVTCLATNRRATQTAVRGHGVGDRVQSTLVVGTERGQLLYLNAAATTVTATVALPAPPVKIEVIYGHDELVTSAAALASPAATAAAQASSAAGAEDRMLVACRDGRIYLVHKQRLVGTVVDTHGLYVDFCALDASRLLVATADAQLLCYYIRGARAFALALPSPALTVASLAGAGLGPAAAAVGAGAGAASALVTLASGELRVYTDKRLVHTAQLPSPATAALFGRYGREDGALALVFSSGALAIRLLHRSAHLGGAADAGGGTDAETPPAGQDVPLPIPKKTHLFVQQAAREAAGAPAMHAQLQKDFARLRLRTARALATAISAGVGAAGPAAGASAAGAGAGARAASLRLDTQVIGLGPHFSLELTLRNTGSRPAHGVVVTVGADPRVYAVGRGRALLRLPVALPTLPYKLVVPVSVLPAAGAAAADIKVTVATASVDAPVLTAFVPMPSVQAPV
jgi:hypothetical protein